MIVLADAFLIQSDREELGKYIIPCSVFVLILMLMLYSTDFQGKISCQEFNLLVTADREILSPFEDIIPLDGTSPTKM